MHIRADTWKMMNALIWQRFLRILYEITFTQKETWQ